MDLTKNILQAILKKLLRSRFSSMPKWSAISSRALGTSTVLNKLG